MKIIFRGIKIFSCHKSFVLFIFLIGIWNISIAETLKTGDLIFVVDGKSDFSNAIAESTGGSDRVKFVHVGIIEITECGITVIEASPEEGVRVIPLEEFIGNGKIGENFRIMRLTCEFPVMKAVRVAKTYIGEPYDWWYLPDNGKMYCSELVQVSYRNYDDSFIFPLQPMNFRTSDGEMPEFWINLYSNLGIDVPEGIPGTNPQDLSRHPSLKEVYFEQKDL